MNRSFRGRWPGSSHISEVTVNQPLSVNSLFSRSFRFLLEGMSRRTAMLLHVEQTSQQFLKPLSVLHRIGMSSTVRPASISQTPKFADGAVVRASAWTCRGGV